MAIFIVPLFSKHIKLLGDKTEHYDIKLRRPNYNNSEKLLVKAITRSNNVELYFSINEAKTIK